MWKMEEFSESGPNEFSLAITDAGTLLGMIKMI